MPLPMDFEMALHFNAAEIGDDGTERLYQKAILFQDIVSVQEYPYPERFTKILGSKTVIMTDLEEIIVASPFKDVHHTWLVFLNWKKNQKGVYVKFNAN